MNKKRFTIKPQDDYWAVVDNHNEDKVCIINGIHTEIEAEWLCDFMNEQQSIINRNEISMNTMMSNMEKLEKEIDEQQSTISALKDIFKDIITYSEWDSKKPYCSLGIAVDRKTYYKIREILNE